MPAYCIVDCDASRIEVWTPGDSLPSVERETAAWHPVGAGKPFTIALAELFRPI